MAAIVNVTFKELDITGLSMYVYAKSRDFPTSIILILKRTPHRYMKEVSNTSLSVDGTVLQFKE